MSSPADQQGPSQRLLRRLRQRWSRWLGRRLPPSTEVVLTQRRLFIFPSYAGLAFLFMLLVMLIAAINYQNNMAYALTFLLGSVFVVAVHHTFANLHRLKLRAISADSVFPGQQAAFAVRLSASGNRRYHGLRLGWQRPEMIVEVPSGKALTVSLYHSVEQRGWYRPGRFLLETCYPIGLLRCWTWLDLDMRALVYPRPLDPPPLNRSGGAQTEGSLPSAGSGEDIADFRDYRPGDSLRAVNWRAWAKGQALTTKVYGEPVGDSLWLDFSSFDAGGTEQRLSWLCAMVLAAHEAGDVYGMRLPGQEIPPAKGDAHRDSVLRALALYGLEDSA